VETTIISAQFKGSGSFALKKLKPFIHEPGASSQAAPRSVALHASRIIAVASSAGHTQASGSDWWQAAIQEQTELDMISATQRMDRCCQSCDVRTRRGAARTASAFSCAGCGSRAGGTAWQRSRVWQQSTPASNQGRLERDGDLDPTRYQPKETSQAKAAQRTTRRLAPARKFSQTAVCETGRDLALSFSSARR